MAAFPPSLQRWCTGYGHNKRLWLQTHQQVVVADTTTGYGYEHSSRLWPAMPMRPIIPARSGGMPPMPVKMCQRSRIQQQVLDTRRRKGTGVPRSEKVILHREVSAMKAHTNTTHPSAPGECNTVADTDCIISWQLVARGTEACFAHAAEGKGLGRTRHGAHAPEARRHLRTPPPRQFIQQLRISRVSIQTTSNVLETEPSLW